jgi:transposase
MIPRVKANFFRFVKLSLVCELSGLLRHREWGSPSDPDARITKMKDGRTHLVHKAEHALDLTTGALLAMTLQPADQGDTATIHQTLEVAQAATREVNEQGVEEVVADKGYHSGPC